MPFWKLSFPYVCIWLSVFCHVIRDSKDRLYHSLNLFLTNYLREFGTFWNFNKHKYVNVTWVNMYALLCHLDDSLFSTNFIKVQFSGKVCYLYKNLNYIKWIRLSICSAKQRFISQGNTQLCNSCLYDYWIFTDLFVCNIWLYLKKKYKKTFTSYTRLSHSDLRYSFLPDFESNTSCKNGSSYGNHGAWKAVYQRFY